MFLITAGRGFQITFENGYKVSVQFEVLLSEGNRTRWTDAFPESATAETALISPRGTFIRYSAGGWKEDVQTDMTPAEVLELLNYAAQLGGKRRDDPDPNDNPYL